jgi:hypothetical protein
MERYLTGSIGFNCYDSCWKWNFATEPNDMRYACFPESRRLAVMRGGRVRVYDTGAHRIGGFSQQQDRSQSLSFSSQLGSVRLEDLPEV